jgi:hypothetical protein
MKWIIVGAASVAVLATASPALAWDRYDIRPDPNGTSMSMDGTPLRCARDMTMTCRVVIGERSIVMAR